MKHLLLVRHGETDMKGTFCGHSDPSLNGTGLAQLPRMLHAIGSTTIDLVVSSDLRRAQQTAACIAEHHGAEMRTRPGLREIFFGDWEGLTWAQIEARDSAFAQRWIEQFPQLTPPGGEPVRDFESRVRAEWSYLSALAASCSLAAVTHAGVMRTLLTAGSESASSAQTPRAARSAASLVIDYAAVVCTLL